MMCTRMWPHTHTLGIGSPYCSSSTPGGTSHRLGAKRACTQTFSLACNLHLGKGIFHVGLTATGQAAHARYLAVSTCSPLIRVAHPQHSYLSTNKSRCMFTRHLTITSQSADDTNGLITVQKALVLLRPLWGIAEPFTLFMTSVLGE